MRQFPGLLLAAALAFAPGEVTAAGRYDALFEAVWSTVNENFYDPSMRGVDWAETGRRYRARLAGVQDDAAFQQLIKQMLAELRVSHLYLSAPAKSPGRRIGLGARFEPVEGRQTVVEVAPLSDARRQGLRVGDQLVGEPAALAGPPGTRADVQVIGCDGKRRRLSVRREAAFWPPAHPGWTWSQLSPEPGVSLGYIRIDRFDDGAAELADQAMAELGKTRGLIIDLRNSSGGNISALRLASYFGKPGPAVALYTRQSLKGIGRAPTLRDIEAGPKVVGAYTTAAVFKAVSDNGGAAVFHTEAVPGVTYSGKVVVLIGPETGSAAEGFGWAMRWTGRATFMGRRTAAALLSGESFPLEGGWTLTVPVHGLWGPKGEDLGDKAVEPDVAAAPSRAALCEGRDAELEAAQDLLTRP
ncbi:S41 family peptidase [Phenylobacterium sp.]|jgi:carboxyl-terminal processing protease|uniref:S41 family peptidase n=1 Tax=Phenylobacterium sp. TaxID=1871053 RepID=UPI002F957EAC